MEQQLSPRKENIVLNITLYEAPVRPRLKGYWSANSWLESAEDDDEEEEEEKEKKEVEVLEIMRNE